mmetsp:Transcript_29821/g.40968  ORF Transcript_29821/g.40968 Transcript_29821/m.40968 type:complete len:257 (+) Transcript_29821:1191-1961(+)
MACATSALTAARAPSRGWACRGSAAGSMERANRTALNASTTSSCSRSAMSRQASLLPDRGGPASSRRTGASCAAATNRGQTPCSPCSRSSSEPGGSAGNHRSLRHRPLRTDGRPAGGPVWPSWASSCVAAGGPLIPPCRASSRSWQGSGQGSAAGSKPAGNGRWARARRAREATLRARLSMWSSGTWPLLASRPASCVWCGSSGREWGHCHSDRRVSFRSRPSRPYSKPTPTITTPRPPRFRKMPPLSLLRLFSLL